MQLFKGINVVSITVSDLERAKSFYSDVLGLGAPLIRQYESRRLDCPSGLGRWPHCWHLGTCVETRSY
ncbi:MAG: VOC family protein [Caldilinea sp. CFX5]|nr:VOC family protein [Caldilinea sp. CFX5]